MNIQDKVYIITGTASGIGKACAEVLIQNEARIIGLDKLPSAIKCEKYTHYVCDVTKEKNIKSVISRIYKNYGQIDGLLNCVGIYSNSKPFYEMTIEEWDRVIKTNLTSIFILSKYVSQKMKRNKTGKIINISCIRSKIFRPNMADYAASKGGVVALTSAMALDLAPFNITVNSIAPGFTYTCMTKKSFDDSETKSLSESLIPVGKIGKAKDIANVALFLFSEMSDYINGETIFVDGGYKISK